MAADAAALKARFPEFGDVDNNVIEQHIADATLRVGAGVWGAKRDLGIIYLAAHTMTTSPGGRTAKKEKTETLYERLFKELRLEVTSGFRVT